MVTRNRRTRHVPVRVGESVASELRERILGGQYERDLPKQESLMAEFEVSAPSIREAFRVLEAEGLIQVRRGNVGGAIVRLPTADNTAYALGLALQAQGALVSEVAATIWQMDPLIAQLCAGREDRTETVVPVLRATIDEIEAADDGTSWEYIAQTFHDAMGEHCGNRALAETVATLNKLFHLQVDDWTYRHGWYSAPGSRERLIADHESILACIERGDGAGAAAADRVHLEAHIMKPLLGADELVSVTVARNGAARSYPF